MQFIEIISTAQADFQLKKKYITKKTKKKHQHTKAQITAQPYIRNITSTKCFLNIEFMCVLGTCSLMQTFFLFHHMIYRKQRQYAKKTKKPHSMIWEK